MSGQDSFGVRFTQAWLAFYTRGLPAENAGFIVESKDVIGSEWREAWEEDGTHRTSQQLLHAARLIRGEDELQSRMGEIPYRVELSNALQPHPL